MNFFLKNIPKRTKKPRENGLTMMMDKGLSINDTKNFIDMCGAHTDIIKLGFGTSAVSPHIEKKIELYKEAGLMIYLGGTLFEAFIIRDMFEEYKQLLRKWGLTMCEVSDGSIEISHRKKCSYIKELSKEDEFERLETISRFDKDEKLKKILEKKFKKYMKYEWALIEEFKPDLLRQEPDETTIKNIYIDQEKLKQDG